MIDPQKTVSEVVLDHSETARVFQRHRIDFCCSGHKTLEEASQAKGVDTERLLEELAQAVAERRVAAIDPRALSTPELLAHIVQKHHDYLRRALPFVRALALKVGRVHGGHNPKLMDLDVAVGELVDALLPHLDEEEETLFPALVSGEVDGDFVATQLGAMEEEHHAVARLLERVRAATDDFTLPSWACNSYRTLFSELEQLETDTFTHVHLENHVVAPRFAA